MDSVLQFYMKVMKIKEKNVNKVTKMKNLAEMMCNENVKRI